MSGNSRTPGHGPAPSGTCSVPLLTPSLVGIRTSMRVIWVSSGECSNTAVAGATIVVTRKPAVQPSWRSQFRDHRDREPRPVLALRAMRARRGYGMVIGIVAGAGCLAAAALTGVLG